MSENLEYYKAKYQTLEDLPDIGPATVAKLKEIGFKTVESLGTAAVAELVAALDTHHKLLEDRDQRQKLVNQRLRLKIHSIIDAQRRESFWTSERRDLLYHMDDKQQSKPSEIVSHLLSSAD